MHDLDYYGLVHYALQRGGQIHPIIIPPEISKETGLMNPSIFITKDGTVLLNIRHVNYTLYHSEGKKMNHEWGPLVYVHPENDITLRTQNILCELHPDTLELISYDVIDTSEKDTKPTWTFIGLEDGRLFEWDNRLFLCGVRRDCYDDKGKGRMEMQEIAKVDGKWKEISRNPIPAPGDDGTYCEKNWMPILDMPYHFLKWCNPVEVVKFDIEEGTTESVVLDESKYIHNFKRDLRGGSHVIRISPNERLAITHEVDLNKDVFARKDGNYVHRAILWDNDWNITKMTREFSFFGQHMVPETGRKYVIEFVTGIAFHKNDVLISFGYQDNATFILQIPQHAFSEFLQGA